MWKTILADALDGFVAGSRFQHPTIGGEPMALTEAERGANAASYTAGFLSRLEMVYGKEKAIDVFNEIGKSQVATLPPQIKIPAAKLEGVKWHPGQIIQAEPVAEVKWSAESVTVHKPDGTTSVVTEAMAKLEQDVNDGYNWLNYPQGNPPEVTYSFKYGDGASTAPVYEVKTVEPTPPPKPKLKNLVMAVGRKFR